MPSEQPIDFCLGMAVALFKRRKTTLYRPMSRAELALRTANKSVPSPFGNANDVLWVREPIAFDDNNKLVYQANYAYDGYGARNGMPGYFTTPLDPIVRQQARFLLTIQAVDIVNLQTVDEAAAKAAGSLAWGDYPTALDEYKTIWAAAFKSAPWESNPPVWRVTFTVGQV